jgi:hypothetical protein
MGARREKRGMRIGAYGSNLFDKTVERIERHPQGAVFDPSIFVDVAFQDGFERHNVRGDGRENCRADPPVRAGLIQTGRPARGSAADRAVRPTIGPNTRANASNRIRVTVFLTKL